MLAEAVTTSTAGMQALLSDSPMLVQHHSHPTSEAKLGDIVPITHLCRRHVYRRPSHQRPLRAPRAVDGTGMWTLRNVLLDAVVLQRVKAQPSVLGSAIRPRCASPPRHSLREI